MVNYHKPTYKEDELINGMPVKAIEKMLENPKTPKVFREYWTGILMEKNLAKTEKLG